MKTEKLPLAQSLDQIITQFSQVISNMVNRVTVDFDEGTMDVLWTPVVKGEELTSDTSDVDIREIFEHIRVTEYSGEALSYNPEALAKLTTAMQEMTGERTYASLIICRETAELKKWLGLPNALPLTTFAGVPVIAKPDLVVEGCLYILGARFYGATPKSMCTIRRVSMEEMDLE